jgi:Cdc6-like AAA superfamily ATPase
MNSEALENINPFNIDYPPGKHFVGREKQLIQLDELLRSLSGGSPQNMYIVGKGGTGKTSYLDRVVEEASSRGMLSYRCTLDPNLPAEENIDIIILGLIRAFQDKTGQLGFEEKWRNHDPVFKASGAKLRSDELAQDFNYLCKLMKEKKINHTVICIDEGQNIHALAVSTLKRALQSASRCYMIVLSFLNETATDDKIFGNEKLDEFAKISNDPGAKRFFQNFSRIGDFESDKEARDCIASRLTNNVIKFDNDTITEIVNIMRRHPRKTVLLSRVVYELVQEEKQTTSKKDMVHKAFCIQYENLINEIKDYKETWSSGVMNVYSALASSDGGLKASEIAEILYPKSDNNDLILKTIDHSLNELSKIKTRFTLSNKEENYCREVEGGIYFIYEPEIAYAMKLVSKIGA